MQKILILFLFLFLTQNTYYAKPNQSSAKSKIKTIKFHKAETEAEKALDRILMISQDLIKEYYLDKDVFTKGFLADEARQQKEYEKENNCSPEHDMCVFGGASRHVIPGNDYITDIGFLYNTIYSDEDLIYIYTMSRGYKKNNSIKNEYIRTIESLKDLNNAYNYTMKKEDGKWKIDGLCWDHLNINHSLCVTRYKLHFAWDI